TDIVDREPSLGPLAFREEALLRIVGRLREVGRLRAFLAMKAYEEDRGAVSAELRMSPNHVSKAAGQLLKKLEGVLRERVQKYLGLEPGADLSKEDLDRVRPESWHYLSEEMSQLLHD